MVGISPQLFPDQGVIYDSMTGVLSSFMYPDPNADTTHAYDINNKGEIVGQYRTLTETGTLTWYGFYWDGTNFYSFKGMGIYGINDNGVMVGGSGGNAYIITRVNEPTRITIDIKPGSDPNSINLKSNGVVPVAILSTIDFEATVVDPGTVLFVGASPVKSTMEDVNQDGDIDLLLHFKTQDLNLTQDSTEATLTGETMDGTLIEGTDTVNIVPKKKK